MQGYGDQQADDMALSALIDDELPETDAQRMRTRLATDAWLAHRFVAMVQATAAIRLAYRDAMDVVSVVAAVYARAIREDWDDAADGLSNTGPMGDAHAPMRNVDLAVARLTTEQRIALCLAVLEDLSYPEIAAALRVADGDVRARLAEARASLAASFGESWLANVQPASKTRH